MGTKVQCSSYQPGFHTMEDLNKNADGCWSEYYGNKSLSRNLYNGYQIRKSNGCFEYDKEMVKRTMLEHEAIFRKQVYELHRLYRMQKNMMDEVKKIACGHLQTNTSESNSFSSQIPSEGTKTMLHMAYLPAPTTTNRRASLTLPDDKKPTLSFLNKKDVDLLDSKNKGLPKRMFDLDLPADVCIDCEAAERTEKETAAESSFATEVPLGEPEDSSCREERLEPSAHAKSGIITWELADLNVPVEEMCLESEAGSVSSNFINPKTPYMKNQGIQLPVRSNTSFSGLPGSFLKRRHCDERMNSNRLHAVDEDSSRETSLFNIESGQIMSSTKSVGPSSLKEKSSLPSEPLQLCSKPQEILSEQNKRDAWFKPMLEIPCTSPQNGQKASPFPHLYSNAKSYSHAPSAVPSFHCFSGADTQNHGNPSDQWKYTGDLLSQFSVGINTTYQNGFNQGLRLGYNKRSQLHTSPITTGRSNNDQIDVHLNQTLLNGFLNGITNKKIKESEGKCGNSLGASSQPQREPTCNTFLMNSRFERRHEEEKRIKLCNLQDLTSSSKVEEMRHEEEKRIKLCNLQELTSSSKVEETTSQINETSDTQSSKKIFGFLIPETNQQAQTVVTKFDEKDQVKLPISRDCIDLNFDLNLLDHLAKDEKIPIPIQVSAPKVALEFDLEEAPIESLELEKQDEAILVKEAAESILLISSDKVRESTLISCDTLYWFAEVAVTSNIESSKDTLDPFEQMTLELEETKPEEYLHQPWEVKDQTDEENDGKSNIASLLITKPRRGQARKRRQRRDFQKDVLPGLASLSHQEVTEDLQTIGGLMKALGHCWPSDQNGMSSRRRVGRRTRRLAITVGEVHVSSLSPLPKNSNGKSEMEVDGRSMISWGRTTKRCRRLRVPPVTNVAAPLT